MGGAAFGFLGLIALRSETTSANTVYTQELVVARWRAPMAGTVNMAVGVGLAATAIAGGYIIGTSGYRSFFLIAAGLTVAGTLLFWGYFRVLGGEFAGAAALGQAGQPD